MSLNRRESLAGLLAAAAGPALAKAAPTLAKRGAPPIWADAEARANKLIADKLVPGLQVCVRRRGAVVYSKGFGLADIETATPMRPASVCKIGSITKQFTAAAILLLAQDGQLSLNDSLAVYMPEFPNAQKLPLRRMLSHTSGLGNYTENIRFMQLSRTDRSSAELLQAMVEASPKLKFEPGTDWQYSNTAYVLLGLLVEKASGKPYPQFMRERLFAPAGLTHTAVDNMAEIVPNRAAGYSIDVKAPSGFDNSSFIAMTYPGGAGAIRSTCEDLCAWHGALLGGKVLQPEMLKEMLTPATLNDGNLPQLSDGKGGKTPMRYGFGLFVGPVDGRPAVYHDGGIQGFVSHLETEPDDQVTIATIINDDGGRLLGAPNAALQKALRSAALAA
jgi:CubicO group peptidase (beta-lactamase class C family)